MEKRLDKKILFLTSWYPSKENLLLGNFVEKHATIANEVAEVDVLFAVSSNKVDKLEISDKVIEGVRTVIVYYPKVKSKMPIWSSFLKKKAYLNALQTGFDKLHQKYDLVHLNISFPAGLFALKLKKNYQLDYLVTEQWTGFLPHKQTYLKLPFYIKRAFKKVFKNAKLVLPVSDHLGQHLKKLNLVDSYHPIHNVVNDTFFYPAKEKRDNNAPIRFLHVSTFDDAHKNISGMLTAFSQMEYDYVLHIITEGEEKEVWEMLGKFNIPKNRVAVDCKQTAKEVGKAMRQADCLVLFSNYETFSVVLAEAWTTGIPVIYSQCGGITEVNNPILGVQIQPKDTDALIKALSNYKTSDYSKELISDYSTRYSVESLKTEFRRFYK